MKINQNFFLFPDNTETFKYFIYSIFTTSDLYVMVGNILILISQDIVILRLNVVFCSYDSFRFIYFFKPFSLLFLISNIWDHFLSEAHSLEIFFPEMNSLFLLVVKYFFFSSLYIFSLYNIVSWKLLSFSTLKVLYSVLGFHFLPRSQLLDCNFFPFFLFVFDFLPFSL